MRKVVLVCLLMLFCNISFAVNKIAQPEWELVNQDAQSQTMRLFVFGGWLIKSKIWNPNGVTMVFLPDQNHDWKLEQ